MKKGLQGWFEIFKGGRQKDSRGVEHDGDALVDKAVATFDPKFHEPPLVKGHPKHDAPAYGWLEAVKSDVVDGVKVLFGKAKDVVPEFNDMVQDARFKKRSASFYPDGRIRHVGFLGAMPPAVKGLADVTFSEEDDAFSFDFSDEGLGVIARFMRRMREFVIEKFDKETADQVVPDWDVEYIGELANRPQQETSLEPSFHEGGLGNQPEDKSMDKQQKVYTKADIDAAREAGKQEGKGEAQTEFSEQQDQAALKARKKAAADFVETKIKEGVPLQPLKDKGLVQFMEALEEIDGTIEFSEGKNQTPAQFFREFISELGTSPLFKEMVAPEEPEADFAEGADTSDLTKHV